MYSGVLQLSDNDLIYEVIGASDYFQMTALKEALDIKYKGEVVPSNVLSLAKVADLHSMPLLKDMCDRIQLVCFTEVIKNDEYAKLSSDEVLKYFEMCKLYAGISSDDLLQAALKWMEENEPFPELMQQIDLMKCSPSALEAAVNRSDTPQDIVALIKKCNITKQQKQQSLVYMTCDGCYAVDKTGQCREFEAYDDKCDIDDVYNVCNTDNGYVFIKEEHSFEKGTGHELVRRSVFKYDAIKKDTTQLPGVSVLRLDFGRLMKGNIAFSIIHKDKIYTTSQYEHDHLLSYDMKDHLWSKIPFPKESYRDRWTAAVAGDDLFLMNGQLHLYRLRQGKLERINTELNKSNSTMLFFSMTAVHRWLYIFAVPYMRCDDDDEDDEDDKDDGDDFEVREVHCYDTASGIWTNIPVECFWIHNSEAGFASSSIMFGNKIYFINNINAEKKPKSVHQKLYEYNLVDDDVNESRRPYPNMDFYLAVKDVSEEMLEAEVKARFVSDAETDSELSDSSGNTVESSDDSVNSIPRWPNV